MTDGKTVAIILVGVVAAAAISAALVLTDDRGGEPDSELITYDVPGIGIGTTQVTSYSDSFFTRDNTVLDWSLANASYGLALTSMVIYFPPQQVDVSHADRYVSKYLERIGFNGFSANGDYNSVPREDSIGVAVAKKVLPDGRTLLAVAVRGGAYGQEWVNNFDIGDGNGTEQMHRGFYNCAQKVLSFVNDYIDEEGVSGRIAIWTSGYSRSAGIANAFGAILDKGIASGSSVLPDSVSLGFGDIYDYTFEGPRTTADPDAEGEQYGNIINMVCDRDLVTMIPGETMGFLHYGQTFTYPVAEDDKGLSSYIVNAMKAAGYGDDRYGIYDKAVVKNLGTIMKALFSDKVMTRGTYTSEVWPWIGSVLNTVFAGDRNGYTELEQTASQVATIPESELLDNDKRLQRLTEVCTAKFSELGMPTEEGEKLAKVIDYQVTGVLGLPDWTKIQVLLAVSYFMKEGNQIYVQYYHMPVYYTAYIRYMDPVVPNERPAEVPWVRPRDSTSHPHPQGCPFHSTSPHRCCPRRSRFGSAPQHGSDWRRSNR